MEAHTPVQHAAAGPTHETAAQRPLLPDASLHKQVALDVDIEVVAAARHTIDNSNQLPELVKKD